MDFLGDLQQSWTMRHLNVTVTVIATAALLAGCDSKAVPTSGTDALTAVSHAGQRSR